MSSDREIVGIKPVLWIFGFVLVGLGFVCTGVLSFIVGGAIEDRVCYHGVFESQQKKIEPILAASGAYTHIRIEEESTGNAALIGQVPSEESLAKLRREMERLFGEDRAKESTSNITIVGQVRRE